MKCKSPEELIHFLKDPLAPEEELEISGHLFDCMECRARLIAIIDEHSLERRQQERRQRQERRRTITYWDRAERRTQERRKANRRDRIV